MEIRISREWKKPEYTISRLYVDGEYFGCNTLEDTDRGLKQSMSIAEIAKLKVYGKTAIPTGRYEVVWNYSNKFKRYMPQVLNVKGFEGIRIHCLTPDMEVLTEKGWQNLESYKNDIPGKCYSYNMDSKQIELVNIDNFIEQEYNGDLYSCNGKRVNYSVTDKHRMYVATKNRKQEYSWGIRTADDVPSQAKFITAGYKDGETLTPEQKSLFRLIMATQADGYILNRSHESVTVIFHFVKERKIQRVKRLIEDVGGSYTEFVDKEMKTHIHVDATTSKEICEYMNPCHYLFNYKELPLCLLNFKSCDLRDLVMEYLFFDGRWENYLKNNKNMVITSVNLNTLNTLQAMACLSGMRAYIKEGHGNSCYELVLYENQEEVMPDAGTFTTTNYNGTVWCLSNANTTLIVRQNYRPMIIGNCGNTAKDTLGCILVGKNTKVGMVTDSRVWTNKLYAKIQEAIDKNEIVELVIE